MAMEQHDIALHLPFPSDLGQRSKYVSQDLSGSVFLIGANGIISLPMPSRSRRDPLNWSPIKRAMAFVSLMWFSVIGLILVQGASLLFAGLALEFGPNVRLCHLICTKLD
jgi:hypothetical protein